jgi:hypothetical protein
LLGQTRKRSRSFFLCRERQKATFADRTIDGKGSGASEQFCATCGERCVKDSSAISAEHADGAIWGLCTPNRRHTCRIPSGSPAADCPCIDYRNPQSMAACNIRRRQTYNSGADDG